MNDMKNSPRPEPRSFGAGARRSGLGCSIALALLLVALVGGTAVAGPRLLRFFDTRSDVTPLSTAASEEAQKQSEQRTQQLAELDQYGWVDQGTGIAHIPIARAIALIAAQGLPVGIPATATPAPTAAASATVEVTTTVPAVDLANLDFARDVLPIFEAHCTKCHGGDNPEEGLELTSRKKILAGSLNGSVVKPGDPEQSYLVEMITTDKMPKKGPPLTQMEKDIIIAWIKAGAPDSPTPAETPAATGTLSATAPITATAQLSTSAQVSETAQVSPSATLSQSAPLTATALATPTLDLSSVDLDHIVFSTDVLPIFEAHCTKCHGGDNPEEGLELTSRKKVLAGSLNGSVVKPGDPDASYLVKMITEGKMPKRGAPLSQLEIDIIVAWIKAGALDDESSASSTLTSTTTVSATLPITITPTAATPNVTPTVVATVTQTATVVSQISDSRTVTPTRTLTATKPAATATPTVTKGATATVTRTPTVTPVEANTPLTATLAAPITDTTVITSSAATSATNPSPAPITETTTLSSTFDPSKVDLSNVSFSNDVLPIFEQHCFKCHGEIDNPEEGLQLTSRKKVMAGSLNGGVVSPGNPDESYLVEMIVKGKMPKKGEPLTQTEIDVIVAWIEQGALDN